MPRSPHYPWSASVGSMPWRTATGSPGSGIYRSACPPKPSGNLPPAAAFRIASTPGATNCPPSRPTVGATVPNPSARASPTDTGSSTCARTFTNGAAIGTTRPTTPPRTPSIRKAPRTASAARPEAAPGGTTSSSPVAPRAAASPPISATPTTASAQRHNASRRAKQRAVSMTSDLTHEKQQLHELVDRLAPSQVSAVRGLLQVMLDPVSRAIANAPVDDEPLTAEEAHAFNEAREWLKHNEPIPHERVPRLVK